jgi:hypothetical protein
MLMRSRVDYDEGAFWIRIIVILLSEINSERKIFGSQRISAIMCVVMTNLCLQV